MYNLHKSKVRNNVMWEVIFIKIQSLFLKILVVILVWVIAVITKNGSIFDTPKVKQNINSNEQVIISDDTKNSENISEKNAFVALLLTLIVPLPGIQSFYAGRWGRGIAQLLTFNFLCIGLIYDLVMICTGKFKDSKGKCMKFKI